MKSPNLAVRLCSSQDPTCIHVIDLVLIEHAKPFVPPTDSQILRFKTHNYMGEPHPVESKCVLNVKVDLLGLNDQERHKLLVLSGPRYNPESGELTLSSEKFPYVNQNKKYLSDLLDKLIAEAKVIEMGAFSIMMDKC
jgi:small subunit ribosomal protein S35